MKRILFVVLLLLPYSLMAQQKSLVFQKGKVYSYRDFSTPLPHYEVEQMMYNKSAFVYDQYKNGYNMRIAGSVTLGIGVPSTAVGIILTAITYSQRSYYHGYYYYYKPTYLAGWSLFGIGLGLTSAGIPLYTVGLNKMERSVNSYNRSDVTMSIQLKNNGLGLSFKL